MKIILILLSLILLSCSSGPNVAGGSSSETTSGIVVMTSAGSIYGKARKGSELMLFESTYRPDKHEGFVDTILITSDEQFHFEMLEPGNYNLYARDTLTGKGVFINGITAGGAVTSQTAEYRSPGNISGTISANPLADVFLPGTPFTTKTEINGEFTFVQIPVGTYTVSVLAESLVDTALGTDEIESIVTITVLPDTTVTWKE